VPLLPLSSISVVFPMIRKEKPWSGARPRWVGRFFQVSVLLGSRSHTSSAFAFVSFVTGMQTWGEGRLVIGFQSRYRCRSSVPGTMLKSAFSSCSTSISFQFLNWVGRRISHSRASSIGGSRRYLNSGGL